MGGKYGSPSTWFLVDGHNMLGAKIQSLGHKVKIETEPDDGLGDTWGTHAPTGMQSAHLTQDGAFFTTGAAGMHELLQANAGEPRVICLGFAGHVVGAPFLGFRESLAVEYDPVVQLGKLTKANVAYLVSGRAYRGQVVQPLATQTADWDTKTLGTVVDYAADPSHRVVPIVSSSVANPSVITTSVPHGLATGQRALIAGHTGSTPAVNGDQPVTVIDATSFSIPVDVTVGGTGGTVVPANSLTGGVGFQQVVALSGFTGFVGTFRDSADDITYADLVACAPVTAAPGAEAVSVTGPIDRYLAFDGNVTGSGSITVWAGFART